LVILLDVKLKYGYSINSAAFFQSAWLQTKQGKLLTSQIDFHTKW